MARLACLGAVRALVAGCAGSSVPEGTPFAVELEIVQPAPYGPQAPTPQPLAVAITHPEWARVSRLLPEPLPEPIDQGDGCFSGLMLSVSLATHTAVTGQVEYGPCRWPEEITPVRLLMHTLLRRRLAAERRCDCP